MERSAGSCRTPRDQYSAKVRISDELCESEKVFLSVVKVVSVALRRTLGLKEDRRPPGGCFRDRNVRVGGRVESTCCGNRFTGSIRPRMVCLTA